MAQYNEYLKKMIAETQEKIEAMNGFEAPQVAEPVRIMDFNHFADPWDPLYNDEEYAKKTRWGRLIAFPSFFEWMCDSVHIPSLDERGGFSFGMYAGENFELFKPVYPGEVYKVFHKPSQLIDISDKVKDIPQEYISWPKDAPIFSWAEQIIQVYDSNDELVANFQHLNDITIYETALDNVKIAENLPFEKHVYTEEELDFIQGIMKGEELRGANPRYYEDVKVGDELAPATLGPTTIYDMICHFASCSMKNETPHTPLRYEREFNPRTPDMRDPVTNSYKHPIGMHLYDSDLAKMGAMPGPFHFGNFARNCLMRLVTNWMGDDGWIRSFKWRHLHMTPTGDCPVSYGRVVDKKVVDGEPLVEIEFWMENMCRGIISEAGSALVKLPVRAEQE